MRIVKRPGLSIIRPGRAATMALLALCPALWGASRLSPQSLSEALREEEERVELISRLSKTVVCIFDPMLRGGGSGVLIDADGYGLTNFHVVESLLAQRRGLGGLSDGRLYELHVLGVDPGGDVAMFRLGRAVPPPQPPALASATGATDESTTQVAAAARTFEFVRLGRSHRVSVGDPVLAMGNPFMLSEDFTPTVTRGIVSGIHRYQYGEGNQLLYSDCIQTDAAINPGNSGGPLFNAAGELIGINGRISINSRGRLNVGVGFAIGIDQIRRFMPGLRAGLLVRHGTLQATVTDRDNKVLFDRILEDGPAWRAGIRPGDRLLAINGTPIHSANHVASLLGTYPENWPLVLTTEHNAVRTEQTVRLEAIPVKLDPAFVVDPKVNADAVRRVFAEHVCSMLSVRDARSEDKGWRFRLLRRGLNISGRDADAGGTTEMFVLSFVPGRPAELKAVDDGARTRAMTRFDAREASIQHSPSCEKVILPAADALPLRLLYFCLETLTSPMDEAAIAAFTHVGADADVGTLTDPDAPVLEVVERPFEGAVNLRLSFEDSRGAKRLRLGRLADGVEGLTATIRIESADRHGTGSTGIPPRMELRCMNKSDEPVRAWTLEWEDGGGDSRSNP